jgi:hypothetical protein
MANIPNPDVNSTENEGGRSDIEHENEGGKTEIPLPPDEVQSAPVEEPPAETNQGAIDEPERAPKEIV